MKTYRIAFDMPFESLAQAEHYADGVHTLMSPGTEVAFVEEVRSGTVARTLIYTDGGCDIKKNGLGAWAYVMIAPGAEPVEMSQALVGTTNNQMELRAVIEALKAAIIGDPITVVSDSEYVIKGVTSWSRNWVRNGWLNSSGRPVVNQPLWEELLELYKVHDVTFRHVRGHTGDEFNERCDELCTARMIELHKSLLDSAEVPDAHEG